MALCRIGWRMAVRDKPAEKHDNAFTEQNFDEENMALRWGTGIGIGVAALLAGALYWGLTQKPAAPLVRGVDVAGKPFALSDWRGHPVLVDFWATSCPGCVEEMPRLVALYRQYHPAGFELVAVAMNYDDAAQVQRFAAEQHLPFTVVIDAQGDIAHAFGDIRLTPTAFLIDKEGKIAQQIIGDPDFADLGRRLSAG